MAEPLPVDSVLEPLLAALQTAGAVVLQAPTGSGKTTRVPPALARAFEGLIVVVEPRRVAARASARRVAQEWGCELGAEVGYQVRYDRRIGPATRVAFVTEGILLRWLQRDPFLEHVGAVVLDEFHERSVDSDLALSLLKNVRDAGAEVRLVAMSATLDPGPLAAFLDAPVITSEGRLHPVEIRYAPRPSSDPLEDRVAEAVASLPTDGDVLVFLPGRAEISRAAGRIPHPTLQLHGGLDAATQDAVFSPSSPARRIILATNVAESSVTVPRVRYVVDSGLARIPRLDPGAGIDVLECVPIAQDSAEQRSGRAGRLGPGLALRLWTAADHRDRPAFTTPAIHRTDLAPTLLALLAFGEPDPRAFTWFDRPAEHALELGMDLLRLLGALDPGLTPLGARLAELPLHPRLGRFLLEAHDRGATNLAARWVTWLSEGGRPSGQLTEIQPPPSPGADRLAKQLGPSGRTQPGALQRAAIAGWPDRVARQRGESAVMAGGLGVVGSKQPWFVAVGLHAARRGPRGEALVELECAIDPLWLEETEAQETRLDGDRVCTFDQWLRGGLVLKEHPAPLDRRRATQVLVDAATKRELSPNDPAWEGLIHRLTHLQRTDPHPALPADRAAATALVLPELCSRHTTLGAVKKDDWGAVLLQQLPWNARQILDQRAPERIQLGHRPFRLEWTPDGPVLAARIQHLFGVASTPRVGGEPVLVHLLAPNGRPQQITRDLGGFWKTTYFEVRKELRHRYPKHPWPDDPV